VKPVNRFLDVVMSLIDMFQGTVLQALREGIVFFLGNIAVGLLEQFSGTV
jgi:hypothetical protein